MQTGCCTPWKMRVGTSGWWPSGEQSITQMSEQVRRRSSRIFSKPGPLRKPATVMKQTMPSSSVSGKPVAAKRPAPKTFSVAQRQK